ncbi:hypothetical protein PPTG_20106 [Phytophthora nicotianae INRA-310]|uniref:Uncharacterized protein n=1 Tax=Phytophthora nicotianae (strain INRA-310) TaxID=761204 RepID=W2PBV9_PHYN3|nr:hypothetical protein PPTG_20106 [Phytophthora nicotianae INRA-310]ETM97713.1 hypothetical protein PPTG_20106 [Phytophthora nicotianae INRA-310]
MAGLPAINPLDPVVTPEGMEAASLDEVRAIRGANFAKLAKALEELHKRVAIGRSAAERKGRAKSLKRAAKMAQFATGDFVLYADVWSHRHSKLRVKWCGPARVVDTSSNWVFTVENLLTGETNEAHATRLKFYSDSSLGITEDLIAHVAHNREGHVVEKLLKAR